MWQHYSLQWVCDQDAWCYMVHMATINKLISAKWLHIASDIFVSSGLGKGLKVPLSFQC